MNIKNQNFFTDNFIIVEEYKSSEIMIENKIFL
jgi:hypothetical protein